MVNSTPGYVLGTLPPRILGVLNTTQTPGSIDLQVTSIDFPVWTGAKDGNWVTSASVTTGEASDDWVLNSNNSTTTDFVQGDATLFNDNASNFNVNISSGNVQPSTMVFNNSTNAYTISSGGGYGIAGSASLTKYGSDSLNHLLQQQLWRWNLHQRRYHQRQCQRSLGHRRTEHDRRHIEPGCRQCPGQQRDLPGRWRVLDNTSAATLLLPNNTQTWAGGFTFTGTRNLNMGTGAVSLATNSTVTITDAPTSTGGTLIVNGIISNGSGGTALTKAGSGTLILGGANTYGGGLTINGGIVQVTSPAAAERRLGGGINGSYGSTVVSTNATLVGAGSDAFGYSNGTNPSPASINISGGMVTNTNASNYRITLPNLIFQNGGTLTFTAGNTGSTDGEYSLNGTYNPTAGYNTCTVTSVASNTTSVINASISLQSPTTFNIAGNTSSGVGSADLLRHRAFRFAASDHEWPWHHAIERGQYLHRRYQHQRRYPVGEQPRDRGHRRWRRQRARCVRQLLGQSHPQWRNASLHRPSSIHRPTVQSDFQWRHARCLRHRRVELQ